MYQIDKITKANLYGISKNGEEIEINIPNITDVEIATCADNNTGISFSTLPKEIAFSFSAHPDNTGSCFKIALKKK